VDHKNPTSHKNTAFWARLLPALALSISTLAAGGAAWASPPDAAACPDVSVGAELPTATIQDANKQAAQIPGFGERVLLILYTDPDVADQNDKFADAVKAANVDPSKNFFQSIGVANMKDAPAKPNWIIRAIIRSKIKKYNVSILADPERALPNQWKLCDCDDKSVVLLVGKDKKLKYYKKGAINEGETEKVIQMIRKEIAAGGGPPA
jgi:predicted transcriptional regulator